MDFSKLTFLELSEFLRFHNVVPEEPTLQTQEEYIRLAHELFTSLQSDPQAQYTPPVVDLFLAQQFLDAGKNIPQKYPQSVLLNLTPEQKQAFGEALNLDPEDPQFNIRLIRVLRILGALETYLPIVPPLVCPLISLENDTQPLTWELPNPPQPEDPESEYAKITCLGEGNCFFHAFLRAVDQLYISSYQTPDTVTEETLRRYEEAAGKSLKFPASTLRPSRTSSTSRNPETVYQVLNRDKYGQTMNKFRRTYACTFRQRLARFIMSDDSARNLVLQLFPGAYEIALDETRINQPQLTEEQVENFATNQVVRYYAGRIGESYRSIEPDILILLSELYNYDIYILSESKLEDPNSFHPFPDRDLVSVIRGPHDLRDLQDPRYSDPNRPPYYDSPNRKAIVLIYLGGVEGHYDLVVRTDPEDDQIIVTEFGPEEPIIETLFEYVLTTQFES